MSPFLTDRGQDASLHTAGLGLLLQEARVPQQNLILLKIKFRSVSLFSCEERLPQRAPAFFPMALAVSGPCSGNLAPGRPRAAPHGREGLGPCEPHLPAHDVVRSKYQVTSCLHAAGWPDHDVAPFQTEYFLPAFLLFPRH